MAEVAPVTAGATLHDSVRQYQWQGIRFLYDTHSALLSDEMGLGKTVQAAIAMSLSLADVGIDRAIVIAPASLTLNWERELLRWAPRLSVRRVTGGADERSMTYQLPFDVLIASYEQIRADAFDRIPCDTFDLVVLDEAQRIKNRDSRTAFSCRLISRKRAWALTATPLENARADLEAVFAFLSPGLLRPALEKTELFARIRPHLLRRRKADVLPELPPVIIQDVVLDLTDEQRNAYEDAWVARLDGVGSQGQPVPTTTLFALITQLKQLCNYDARSGTSSKQDALYTVLQSLSTADDKVIVFSQYVETLRWLQPRLPDIAVDLYHGGMTQDARDEVLTRFETGVGPRVMLMSLRAGGVGLNLQSASVVVMFDRWWNPAAEVQAIYRAHRFDRSRPLHVLRFIVRETIEERIDRILQAKQALFEEYVNEAPVNDSAHLGREELLNILELDQSVIETSLSI